MSELRCQLARMRLQRLDVQKKQWKVAEIKRKWLETLEGIKLQRNLVTERRESLATLSKQCLRQLDAMSQVRYGLAFL